MFTLPAKTTALASAGLTARPLRSSTGIQPSPARNYRIHSDLTKFAQVSDGLLNEMKVYA
jgi:hypothetical protein